MSLPSLTNILVFFEERLSSGRGALLGDVTSVAGILVAFEVAFAGIYLALGSSADFRAIARKVLTVGFFFYVVRHYADILRWVVDGFLFAGEKVGAGTAVNFATLRDPGQIFVHGLNISKPLADKIFADMDSSWMGIPSVDSLWLLVCIICTLFAFAIMSIQVFVTYLEYLLVASAGFILIPFGMFKPTAFMAERVFGAIIAFGVKLMALALIIGISDAFLQTIAVPQTVTWQEAIELCVIALALCFLSLHAPGVAQSLLTGTPNLSFASIAATAASAGVAASSAATTNTAMLSGGAAATLTAAGRFAGGGTAAAAAIPSASEGAPLLQRAARTSAQASLFAAGGMRGLVTGATNSMVSQGMQAFSGGQQSVPSFRKHQQEAQIKQARQLVAEGAKKSVTPQSQTTQSKGSK